MDTMYKLTKQIDALTYNSRAVLNALVRSCIAAGSSNGYTVTRFGVKLTLDRNDIFRLYDFYQNWANGTYGYDPFTSDADEFADIVAKCDAKWSGDGLVTNAIVTHSKIMYLVSGNKDQTGSDFWLGLIRDASSPKLVANSAPIPLNLRTPLYDADLSTKSFSQYETYLFPSGYNKLSIVGMPGDGEEHIGGGKSWLWDIDETLDITAPRITMGYHTDTKRRLENYKDTKFSLSFGYDAYALGERSVALGGLNNISSGTDSAVVGGTRNNTFGERSGIFAGYYNTTLGIGSFASGSNTDSVGPYSISGNEDTCAGDYVYDFTIEERDSSVTVVDCEVAKDSVTGQCFTTDTVSSIMEGTGRNTVRVQYEHLVANGLWDLSIQVGDKVVVYAQTRKDGTNTYASVDQEGYAYDPLFFTVTNISRSNGDYLIQLDDSIPRGDSYESLWVNGGKIAKYEVSLKDINYNGSLGISRIVNPGEASVALNYNTFAVGVNQTVVGQMNVGNRDAKFIVGTGSSYIGDRSFRRNGFVVAPGYGYMQTANGASVIGVSNYGDTVYRDYDAKHVANGAWMRHSGNSDYTGIVWANDAHTEIGLYRDDGMEDNNLTFVRTGSSYLSDTHDVTVRLESMAGTMVISAGSYVGAKHPYDVLLKEGILHPTEGNSIAIYSENGMELRNTNPDRMLSIHNSGYISSTFKGLFLEGETWGALSATSDARSFWVYHNGNNDYGKPFNTEGYAVDYPNVIAQSGFFYGLNDWAPGKVPVAGRLNLPSRVRGSWEIHQGRGFHIINSAVSYISEHGDAGFDISCLVLPGQVWSDESADPPHPKFINSFIYGTGNGGVMPRETYVAEELAYLTDVQKAKAVSYVSYIQTGIATQAFYRNLSSIIDFRTPKLDSGTFKKGVMVAGSNGKMDSYFGQLDAGSSRFMILGREDVNSSDEVPAILAPDDNPLGIFFNRYGPVVAASIKVRLTNPAILYSEFVIISKQNPSIDLGTYGSLVLTGSGLGGVSVTCTVSNTIDKQLSIGDGTYDSAYMYDFLIRNPGGRKDETAPITLVGVIN